VQHFAPNTLQHPEEADVEFVGQVTLQPFQGINISGSPVEENLLEPVAASSVILVAA
jgi:hypothetical protein